MLCAFLLSPRAEKSAKLSTTTTLLTLSLGKTRHAFCMAIEWDAGPKWCALRRARLYSRQSTSCCCSCDLCGARFPSGLSPVSRAVWRGFRFVGFVFGKPLSGACPVGWHAHSIRDLEVSARRRDDDLGAVLRCSAAHKTLTPKDASILYAPCAA